MDFVYLTDITGTLGEWLDSEFDNDVPYDVVSLLQKAYEVATSKLIAIDKGKFGLTAERYNQMMHLYNNDKETVQDIVDNWGAKNCNNGYGIFWHENSLILKIERIDEVQAFDNDIQAKEKAIEDGIKVIPIEELPSNMPDEDKQMGWIDTKENRKHIKEHYKNQRGL